MLSLPCAASGQEDGVCVALTQLSKELLESNSATMQAGGCDSSDCLFCQYRSNSPFHLNAYAGKLTSLLRKRSANGMTLASLNCFIDSPSKQGAVLLTAATSPAHSSGKRQRAASSTGIQGPVAHLPRSAPAPSETAEPLQSPSQCQTSDDPTNSQSTFEAKASQTHSCESLSHPDQGLPSTQPQVTAATTTYVACPFSITDAAGDTDATSAANTARICANSVGAMAEAAAATPKTDTTLHGLHLTPTRSNNAFIPGDAVDATLGDMTATATLCGAQQGASHVEQPHVSSHHHHLHLSAAQQPGNYHLSRHRHSQNSQQHHHHQQHQQQRQSPLDRLALPAPSTALPLSSSTTSTSPSPPPPPPSPTATGRTTQLRPVSRHRVLDLPRGWTFQPEWQVRSDPAPAELREVLRLPISCNTSGGAGGCTAARGARSGPGGASVSFGRGGGVGGGAGAEIRRSSSSSAGIVCSLEFSPDGRLLAAGGVDKQIRLYNLSEVLGDHDDDSDDYLGGSDDGLDDEVLPPSLRTRQGLGQGGGGRQGASGHHPLRRACACDCEGTDGEDDGDDGSSSLLATVQRMPSKISSVAWSPFLDGVLTVGDYDGVLLQLHMASGHQLADVEAHGGRKIWSVSHSTLVPHLVASAADDRTARIWSGAGLSSCVATLQPNPRAAVCSVDFSPTQEHLLALACSDRTAYLYDLRAAARGPLVALTHHTRPASYCRFMGGQRLVTAATDASIALWDVSGAVPSLAAEMNQPIVRTADAAAAAAAVAPLLPVNVHASCRIESVSPAITDFQGATDIASDTPAVMCDSVSGKCGVEKAHSTPIAPASGSTAPSAATHTTGATTDTTLHVPAPCRIFRGHRNEKNFVGLTVRAADGLLACGSECNRAFAYHTSWVAPLATLGRGSVGWAAREEHGGGVGVLTDGDASGGGGAGMQYDITGWGGGGAEVGFVSAVCWQPAEAAALLGLPPLLASATSRGVVSISVLTAATRGQ